MARLSKSRKVALQMLYQADVNPEMDIHVVREMIDEQIKDEDIRDFCWVLYTGVMEWRNQLDAQIKGVAENWSLKRMAPTDRNILRIGAFELLRTDTPASVVIDESVELAKLFGTAQSFQFVNGILDKLNSNKES